MNKIHKKISSVILFSIFLLSCILMLSTVDSIYINYNVQTVTSTNPLTMSGQRKIAIDTNETIWCVYQYNTKTINAGYSTTKGRTWTIINISATGYAVSNPSIAIDSNNTVHFTWEAYDSTFTTKLNLHYRRYTTALSTDMRLTNSSVGIFYPSIAVDSHNNVHIIWVNGTGIGDSDSHIFYKMYNSTTHLWGTEQIAIGYGYQQYPVICIATNDTIFVAGYRNHNPNTCIIGAHKHYGGVWEDDNLITPQSNDATAYESMTIVSNSTRHIRLFYTYGFVSSKVIYNRTYVPGTGWGTAGYGNSYLSTVTDITASINKTNSIVLFYNKGGNINYSYFPSVTQNVLKYGVTANSISSPHSWFPIAGNYSNTKNSYLIYYNNSKINFWLKQTIPQISTLPATGVEETNATLTGNLTNTGEDACTVRFQWGLTTSYGNTTTNQTIYKPTKVYSDETKILKDSLITPFIFFLYDLADGGYYTYAQQVTPTTSYRLGMVALKLWRISATNYSANITFNTFTGSVGTELLHCNFNTSIISTGGYAFYYFRFNSTYNITSGTSYVIKLTVPNIASILRMHTSSGSAYPGGHLYRSLDGITWTVTPTFADALFKMYEVLEQGTLYHYRAVTNNTISTVYGADTKFLTKPYEPKGLTVTNTALGELTLTWAHGLGYNRSVVRGAIGAYPASPTAGISVYNNTGTTAVHSGLTGGDDWYYRAWEYANESGLHQFSDNSSQAHKEVIGTPTVTTNDATGVEETNATLRGTLTDDAGSSCTVRFQYGLTISYGTNSTDQSKATGETFFFNATPLLPGKLYHYRTVAINTYIKVFGADKTFLTKPYEPTGFNYTTIQSNLTQKLNWTHGLGYNRTVIRVSTTTYPATPTSGTQAYNGTGTLFYYPTPLPGQLYFYRAWEYANESGLHQFSDLNATLLAKTKPFAPTNVTVKFNATHANLSWTKGLGSNYTTVYRSETSYPSATALISWNNYTNNSYVVYSLRELPWSGLGVMHNDTNYYFSLRSVKAFTGYSVSSENSSNYTKALLIRTADATTIKPTSAILNSALISNTTNRVRYQYGYNTLYGTNTTNQTASGINLTMYKLITGLTPGRLYAFRAFANNTNVSAIGHQKYFLTKPESLTNINRVYYPSSVNISWTKGTGANRTVIVRRNDTYPSSPTDGTILYNNTGTYYNLTYTSNPAYLRAWSFTTWTYNPTLQQFSENTSDLNWKVLGINVYNESNSSQALTFNLQIRNSDGSEATQFLNQTGFLFVNLTNFASGENIYLRAWATDYQARERFFPVFENNYYNISMYLPLKVIEGGEDEEGGGVEDCQLRGYIDSVSVTSNLTDVTIPLTHILDSMIQVEIYRTACTTFSFTDSVTVTSYTADKKINLTNDLYSMVEVQIYNDSLYVTYGGWITVPTNKYTYNSTNVLINKTALDKNTTMAKVIYYYRQCEGDGFGTWVMVSGDDYNYTTTEVVINKSAIDNTTTMARVNYYYMHCVETTTISVYYIRIVETIKTEYSEFDRPIEGATVTFRRYMNSTGAFEIISTLFTDANGYVAIYLIPNVQYLVYVEKEGYDNSNSSYIPFPANLQGQTTEKIFRLTRTQPTIPDIDYETLMSGIDWTIEPTYWRQPTNFTVYFNITSADCKLEWYRIDVYFQNTSTFIWILLGSDNASNPCGGSVNYSIPNITGKYSIEAWFKKENFTAHQVTQEGSFTYFVTHLKQWLQGIGDMAFYFVLIIIMLFVMGFCFMRLGTGLITGYIGLGVMALGLLMHDVTIYIGQNTTIGGWVIWGITFIVYTIGLFLWSRI